MHTLRNLYLDINGKIRYRKNAKTLDTKFNYSYFPENGKVWFQNTEMQAIQVDGTTNSEGPDQTALLGAV